MYNTISKEKNLIVVTGDGPVTIEDIKSNYHGYINHPDFIRGMDVLIDLTKAQLDMKQEDIELLIKSFETRREERGQGYKVAIVVSNSTNFLLSKEYERQALDKGTSRVIVFTSLDIAKTWLGME